VQTALRHAYCATASGLNREAFVNHRFFLCAFAGIAIAAACGGGSVTDPSPVVGTYTLRTINGQTPPQPIASGIDIVGGRLSLRDGGMVHQEMDLRTISGGVTSDGTTHAFGTYFRRGNRISVTWNGGGSDIFTLSEATITQTQPALTLVYVR
jgi:YD repeat-containing protein